MMMPKKVRMLNSLLAGIPNDTREFDMRLALARTLSNLPVPFVSYRRRCEVLWNQLYRYVSHHYGDILDLEDDEVGRSPAANVIWVMWWQGEAQMPAIVRMCYRQLQSVADGFKVILITRDTYKDYVALPSHILNKYQSGRISVTHLSDVIRCYLLRDWGGLWLDGTIFASELSFDLGQDFYTLRSHGQLRNYFTQGDWSTFVLYCRYSDSVLMRNMCTLYDLYWSEHDRVLVYEMPDYFIRLIYDNSDVVRRQIDAVPDSLGYRELLGIMNDSYNQADIDRVLRRCPLQKMSYKYDALTEVDGHITNFGHLMETLHVTAAVENE